MTFYKSDVTISHTIFDRSIAEDALNIVRSNYEITDTVFRGSRSDAFDSDFSDGALLDTTFLDSGGDGVDLSGSKLEANDLKFANIKDKAISVGEASFLAARSITVTESGSAIVSKDGSRAIVAGQEKYCEFQIARRPLNRRQGHPAWPVDVVIL